MWCNEFDADAAAWLRQLIRDGRLPPGTVDERSLLDLRPADVPDVKHVHFFAGIGGWPLAAMWAGWPADVELWTGSCPCQPFSSNGQRGGETDERHLWPVWRRLVAERRPLHVVGEQVSLGDLARRWLAGVQADMEADGYCFGYAVLPAGGFGAPHVRERVFWYARRADAGNVADAARGQSGRHAVSAVELAVGEREHSPWTSWRPHRWVYDGSLRRTPLEPGVQPVAHGVPARLARIAGKGFGNAIVPKVAAHFLRACMEAEA